jgi:hypothetical protein
VVTLPVMMSMAEKVPEVSYSTAQSRPSSVAYYPDLYLFDRDPDTRKVGWLDTVHVYPKGVPSEELLEALWQFAKAPVCRTRGFHECTLCERRQAVEMERGDERLLLGTAEIRVYGANRVLYAAPTLIYHYVAKHHYQPPDEFVQAAITGPRPPGDDYRALLRRFEIR